jgi:hypothetical protein
VLSVDTDGNGEIDFEVRSPSLLATTTTTTTTTTNQTKQTQHGPNK